MKNILVAGDPSHPEYVLVNTEETMQRRLRDEKTDPINAEGESVFAADTDRASENNRELLEQL